MKSKNKERNLTTSIPAVDLAAPVYDAVASLFSPEEVKAARLGGLAMHEAERARRGGAKW